MGKTSKRPTTSGAMTASSSSSSSNSSSNSSSGKELSAAVPSTELQDLGSLAKQMEEQLMQEFEALLTARRKQENASAGGGKTGVLKASSSSSSSSGNKDQDARDALYWKHMYERLRDLRETDAERLLRETVQHAEEREKSLLDVIAHLEAGGATSKSGKAGGGKMDVRLSDVSLCGMMGGGGGGGGNAAASAMETEEQEAKGMMVAEQEERIASLEGKISDLKRILMAYQRFTSLCVTMERKASTPGGVSKLSCTAINHVHKKAVKFSLKMNVDVEDNLGMDATFRPVANKELLPPFLQQEATLETKQCPLLLLSILKTLFDEKKNGAGKE